MIRGSVSALFILAVCAVACHGFADSPPPASPPADEFIRVSETNPRYWQYQGETIILIGGSKEDNLFQVEGLEAHLDALRAAGGNYVRCTMSSRDAGNLWAFEKDGNLYDLNRPNAKYWQRFENLLKLARDRDIIVQIEVWATFDFYRDNWNVNPFNPKNNGQYDAAASKLPLEVKTHPIYTENPFFESAPKALNNAVVRQYQEKFVDQLLSISLNYPNVLYCMDNETKVTPKWGEYWSGYIKAAAKKRGVTVCTTEMWDAHNLEDKQHRNTIDHPEIYDFVDISQNNHQKDQTHWDRMQRARLRIRRPYRPLNSVKIYGATGAKYGSERDAIERFWRNLIGGLASARFHRPPAGIGLSEVAQSQLKSARLLLDTIDLTQCEPGNKVLNWRSKDEAYCTMSDRDAAIYFPEAGEVLFDASELKGERTVRWLDIARSEWHDQRADVPASQNEIRLKTPGDTGFVAVIEVVKP